MGKRTEPNNWRSVALECARAADDKKAGDIVILDIRGISTVADYFLICAGSSTRHIRAIAEEMRLRLKKLGRTCVHLDGYRDGRWVVLDFAGVIAHVFSGETRNFYGLEALWGDSVRIDSRTGRTIETPQ